MSLYMAHIHIESEIHEDTEPQVDKIMATFRFGKSAETDDHFHVHLAPWLYFGRSEDGEREVCTRLRSMLHVATGLELNVLVVPAERFHFAHTQGSLFGIAHLDPDREGVE